jgi:hypothetical protein
MLKTFEVLDIFFKDLIKQDITIFDDVELYIMFLDNPKIYKRFKEKTSRRGFQIIAKKVCRTRNYKYEVYYTSPQISKYDLLFNVNNQKITKVS